MFKLAIFDLDGTLLDTLADLAQAVNHALRETGYPTHEVAAYNNFIGRGPVYLIERALPEACRDTATVAKVRQIFSLYYAAHSQESTKPYDGVWQMLQALREAGVRIAVLSNKPHAYVVSLCGDYFPGLVDRAAGFRDEFPPKPDPAQARMLMQSFGVSADETVYIGDSGVDMATGVALGVRTIGVTWGFRPKYELESCGASVIVDNPMEILKNILDKLN